MFNGCKGTAFLE